MKKTAVITLVFGSGRAFGASVLNFTLASLDNSLRVVSARDALVPVVTTNLNYLVGSDEVPAAFPALRMRTERGSRTRSC